MNNNQCNAAKSVKSGSTVRAHWSSIKIPDTRQHDVRRNVAKVSIHSYIAPFYNQHSLVTQDQFVSLFSVVCHCAAANKILIVIAANFCQRFSPPICVRNCTYLSQTINALHLSSHPTSYRMTDCANEVVEPHTGKNSTCLPVCA